MKPCAFVLAALAVLAAVALAVPAQEPAVDRNQLNEKPVVAPKPADAMAEDIEIMRRLLDRTLASQQHPGPAIHQATPGRGPGIAPPTYYNPEWGNAPLHFGDPLAAPYVLPGHTGADLRDTQGVYLKGYGVVFTATLALPTVPPVGEPGKPAPKPPSDWERTRQELRGEKAEPEKAPASRDTLAEVVLKVFADNGKHFTQLPEGESITVALTLPRGQACARCHGPADKPPKGRSWRDPLGEPPDIALATDSANEVLEKVAALRKDAQKAALLGDLHQKQGKNEQAATSFEEALKLYVEASDLLQHPGPGRKVQTEALAAVNQEVIVTAAKLIQVYAALGQKDRVTRMLKVLDGAKWQTGEREPALQTAAAPAADLSAKLVISATKKQLDLVGAGKITFEEFRKSATVDYQPGKEPEKRVRTTGGGAKLGLRPADDSEERGGVMVGEVIDGGPAARAGVKVGDRIVELAGKSVGKVEDLLAVMGTQQAGATIDAVVLRDGKRTTLRIKLQ